MEGISIIFWVDPSEDKAENKKNLKYLEDYLEIKYLKDVKSAITEIKKKNLKKH